ncbi:Bacteriophage HK97-gp10, putative tail-component [uncultured Caudovirales phage]|uniref:Bacteriophage HK97-gp10, putative tail-component n=1 Tax=uncultured Caudovirales phage TaxID=2100421 RepID=A0A6J5N6A0_9CAUD|nr:Bacteriophage HK97-gp10, putative tail-component [uncultured Caudovirales phage]
MAKESIKGIDKVIKELRAKGKEVEKLIDDKTAEVALQIELDAKILAPKDLGKLAQSIHVVKVKESNYKIVAGVIYAPYVEFGTGGLVNVPKEWGSYPMQFKGKGAKQINIRPQPYLYPSWMKGKKDYLDKLKKLLSTYKKKI